MSLPDEVSLAIATSLLAVKWARARAALLDAAGDPDVRTNPEFRTKLVAFSDAEDELFQAIARDFSVRPPFR